MGFSISWVAFQNLDKTAVLQRAGFRDLGIADKSNEAPFSAAELPTGWVVIFSNSFNYGSSQRLCELSKDCVAVSCQVEEHVMYSAASCAVNGKITWSVQHVGGEGDVYDLSTSGIVPAQFYPIVERLHAEQKKDEEDEKSNSGNFSVDYYFDIPVRLAEAITGYCHDRVEFGQDKPNFTVLKPDNMRGIGRRGWFE